MNHSVKPTRHIGARIERFEDTRFLSGTARYLDDITLPRMLHARFVRADMAHANILGIDAEALDDIGYPTQVFTGDDIGDLAIKAHQDVPEMQYSEQPLLAKGRVRFVGEAIAVVLAEDAYQAEDAAEMVFADLDPLQAVSTMEQARDPEVPTLFDGWNTNVFIERQMKGGDIEQARAGAAHIVTRTYRTQRQAGVPMECRGVVAEYNAGDNTLTVWSSTQCPHLVRTCIAEELGFPESRLRVIAPDVGGGFGVKGQVYPEELLIPWLAMKLKRPVKWVEDRREHMTSSIHARDHCHTLEAYLTADGRLLGLKADISVDNGAYSTFPFTAAGDPGMAAKVMPGPYDFQHYEATFRALATNKCPIGTYRGVGRPSAVFSQERLMDDIANELGLDPIEFRLKNIVREFPYKNVLGFTYDEGSYAATLEKTLELMRDDRAEALASKDDPNIKVGVGIACFVEQTAHGTPDFTRRRVPIETGYIAARVEMTPDGQAMVDIGLQNHGQGHETVMAQVAADALGIRPQDILVRHGDTLLTPYSVGTWGSRGGALGGGAVHLAAGRLADKLKAIAAHLLEADADQIVLCDGIAQVEGEPERQLPIARLARAALRNVDQMPKGMEPGLERITRSMVPPMEPMPTLSIPQLWKSTSAPVK